MKAGIALLLFLCATCLLSQTTVVVPERAKNQTFKADILQQPGYSSAKVVQPPADLLKKMANGGTLVLPTPAGNLELTVKQFDVLTPEAAIVQRTMSGDQSISAPKHVMLSGEVKNLPGSSVFLAVFETHVSGTIRFPEEGNDRIIIIAPDTIIPGSMAAHIVARQDMPLGEAARCHSEELDNYQRRSDSVMDWVSAYRAYWDPSTQAPTEYVLSVAIECSYSYYQRLHMSTTNALVYSLTVLGEASAAYRRDAKISLQSSYLRVWTVQDPYSNEIGDAISKFSEYWKSNMWYVHRASAILLSSSISGGLAWVGSTCDELGYSAAGINGTTTFPMRGYTWDVDVVAHELGHNIGASHTHSCTWAPPIDSCWYSEGDCFDYTHARRGTILSYCHLQPSGTDLKFHPRVANLFRAIAATSWCLYPSTNQVDTDLVAVQVIEPQPGGAILVNKEFTPTFLLKNNGKRPVSNIRVSYTISDTGRVFVRYQTDTVPTLATGASLQFKFKPLTLKNNGDYLVRYDAYIQRERNQYNNGIAAPFRVGSAGESVKLVYPVGGEKLNAGDSLLIDVQRAKGVRLYVEYSTNTGETWVPLALQDTATTAPVKVTVPAVQCSTCLLRVMNVLDAAAQDITRSAFTININHDVGVMNIIQPSLSPMPIVSPLYPRAVLTNNGKSKETYNLRCRISWVTGSQIVWDTTLLNRTIEQGATDTVTIGKTPLLPNGLHTIEVYALAFGDNDPSNNSYSSVFVSAGQSPPVTARSYPGGGYNLLRWNVDTASSDKVVEVSRRTQDGVRELVATLPSTVTAWLDQTAEDDTLYYYETRTRVQDVASAWSEAKAVTSHRVVSHRKITAAPRIISPEHRSDDVLVPATFVWDDVANADNYEVQIFEGSATEILKYVHLAKSGSELMVPLDFGTQYSWRVRALNHNGVGPWSDVGSFTTVDKCAGNAISLDGKTNRAYSPTWTFPGGDITVEWWQYVKSSDLRQSVAVVIGDREANKNRFTAQVPNEYGWIMWDHGTNDTLWSVVSASYAGYTDKWTHVALVSDGRRSRDIYLDGKLVMHSDMTLHNGSNTLRGLNIGSMLTAAGPSKFHKALIDEFRIWNSVRTSDQINAAMHRRMPPDDEVLALVGYWRFNEASGTLVEDRSFTKRPLTLSSDTLHVPSSAPVMCKDAELLDTVSVLKPQTSGAGFRTGEYMLKWTRSPKATWYDVDLTCKEYPDWCIRNYNVVDTFMRVSGLPSNSIITCTVRAASGRGVSRPTSAALQTDQSCESTALYFRGDTALLIPEFFFDGHGATVEFWANIPDSTARRGSIFVAGSRDNGFRRFHALAPGEAANIYWDFGNIFDNGRMKSGFGAIANKWHHVALVSNGVDSMHIYVDGAIKASSSFADSPGELNQLFLGGNPATRLYLLGTLADFRIWSKAKTSQQIQESMFRRIDTAEHALVSSWLLTSNQNQNIYDATGRTEPVSYGLAATSTKAEFPIQRHSPAISGPRTVKPGSSAIYQVYTDGDFVGKWKLTSGASLYESTSLATSASFSGDKKSVRLTYIRVFKNECVDSSWIDVTVDATTSVEDADDVTSDISVRPNPALESCTVGWSTAGVTNLSLWTETGKCVINQQVASEEREKLLDLNGLPVGVYVVKLSSFSSVMSRILVVSGGVQR